MKKTAMTDNTEFTIFPERNVVYATFWVRFAASFLDGLIVGIPMAILNYALFHTFSNYVTNLVVGWLYSALQESGPNMATIGKRAMRIKVTDMNGQKISFGQATGRHFGKIISGLILLIGYFMMLWDEKSQTLHDKMAGTLVVSAD